MNYELGTRTQHLKLRTQNSELRTMYEHTTALTKKGMTEAMKKRPFALLGFLILCFSLSAFSQEVEITKAAKKEEMRDLGKNYAISLTIEPSDDAAGMTVMTADKHFMVSVNKETSDGRMSLAFEGDILPKDDDLGFVRYTLHAENQTRTKESSAQQISLKGSILAKIDNKIIVAKSKDKAFKLMVTLAH